jgi:PAS domain S-box-containing protein
LLEASSTRRSVRPGREHGERRMAPPESPSAPGSRVAARPDPAGASQAIVHGGRIAGTGDSEARLQLALAGADGGAWDWDFATGDAWWSPEMFALWGLPPLECMPLDKAMALIHEDDREHVRSAIRQTDTHGTRFNCDYRIRHAERGIRWMSSRGQVLRGPDGIAIRLVGVTFDISERREGERRLQLAAERAEVAQQAVAAALYEHNPADGSTVRSPAIEALVGYAADEIEASVAGWTALIHPADRTRVVRSLHEAFRDADRLALEYRVTHKAGRTLWVSDEARLVRDAAGRLIRVVGMVVDITHRKRIEQALRDGEAQQAALLALGDALRETRSTGAAIAAASAVLGRRLRAARVVYAEIDPTAEYAIVSQASHDPARPPRTGRARVSDFGQALLTDLTRGDTVAVDDVHTDGRTAAERTRALLARLRIGALLAVPLHLGGRLAAVLAVHRGRPRAWTGGEIAFAKEVADRTRAAIERSRAAAALAEREARFRAVFEAIDEGYCLCEMILDPDGRPADYRFLEVNRLFESMTGLADACGRTAREMLPGLERRWVDTYARVALGGETLRFEEGSETMGRHFDVFATPVVPNGRFALVFKDVTERRRAEAARLEADRRKDEFLAMLAHELRNPLAPIKNALRLLTREVVSEPGLHALRIGERQLGHMTALIDDLLEVSRVTRGTIALRPEPTLLQEVVQQTVEALGPTLAERGQRLAISMPPDPVLLVADRVRLAQILENLLGNASKYSDEGGRIDLAIAPRPDEVELTVRDDGVGIAPEHLPSLFELFSQVQVTIDRSRGGLGIGLALVKRLAELHGGRVRAHSDGPGRGATFSVVFPRKLP